jgi:putative ABC transport system permease protein
VRFALLVAVIALLMFLILTQQALQSGLVTAFVGAIERQSAPVLVYSVDGQRTLQGSVITPPLEREIAAVPGVAETGRIGQGTFTASVDNGDLSDAALIGYEKANLGAPESLSAGRMPRTSGEAVGSAEDFSLGDRVRIVAPADGLLVRIVGLAKDTKIQVTPTLFVAWSDYVAATMAVNPDAEVVLPSVIGVRPAAGIASDALAERINRGSAQADALTREQAARETPGVAQVRNSFAVIFLLFALVVPLVSGLFFLIITLQKARALTLLRAIGAPSAVLIRSLLIQVLIVVGGGIVVGTALFAPLSQATVGGLSLRFDTGAVLLWAALLLGLGILSAFAAALRVLAIDPFEATTGGGAR